MPLANINQLQPFNINSSASFSFANVTATGNITGSYLIGNGSQLTGLPASYSDSNVASYLPTYTGNVSGNYFIGNGSALTSITGANVTGTVANATYAVSSGSATTAATVTTAAQPNITSIGSLTSLTSGLITATSGGIKVGNIQDPSGTNTISLASGSVTMIGNLRVGTGGTGNVTATYFIGNGSQLTGLPATYSNTNVASYLSTYTGNITGNIITLTGNVTAINASLGNLVTSNYFTGNGSLLTSLTGANVAGQVANSLVSSTVYTADQPNITSVGTLSSLTVTSNITSGNASLGNLVSANHFTATGNVTANNFVTSGSGGNISGANNIAANTFTGSLTTAAQPNITSVGTLSSLTVTATATAGNLSTTGTLSAGDATITGNLTVNGTTITANATTLNIKDPIIEMGGDTSGALTSNDGKDRGSLLHYYTTTTVDAFMGWDNSNAEFAFGSNVSVASEVTTFNTFGNVRAGYYLGNGSQLTGVTATTATTAATVTTAAQPNITSVGSLTSLTSGLITATSGGIKVGNIQDPSGTNTISLLSGNVTMIGNLRVGIGGTGNITANYFIGNGSLLTSIAGGNVAGQVANSLVAGTVYTNAQPNITSVGTLSSLAVTANITAGNINGGNAVTSNYFVGNGSLLTGLPASYADANVATYLPTYTGNLSPSNLVVSTSANLGAVANITITGGTTGQVLSTDGAGTLSWADQSGGGGSGATIPMAGVQVFTADGTSNTYTLTSTPLNENQISVNLDGVVQLHSSFSLSGNVVTLAGTPVNGATVEITNIAATSAATTGKAIAMAIVFGF